MFKYLHIDFVLLKIFSRDKATNFELPVLPDVDIKKEISTDLKFKKDLLMNQFAAKELYIANYYIKVQKWIPAINRLKRILEKYDKTIFVE